MQFTKPALELDQMIEGLKAHGMATIDQDAARNFLLHTNYYRISAYWHPFKVQDLEDSDNYHYLPGTTFELIRSIYNFDTELRQILSQVLADFEISLRRQWASSLALKYGPFPHLDHQLFTNFEKWHKSIGYLSEEFSKDSEEFIRHFKLKYPDHALPPVWVSAELLTLGGIYHFYKNLKERADRQSIAGAFRLDEMVLESLLRHLNLVRNFVAHHGRIWNRTFAIKFKIPHHLSDIGSRKSNFSRSRIGQIYNTLVMLEHLQVVIHGKGSIMSDVEDLLASYPKISRHFMGFP